MENGDYSNIIGRPNTLQSLYAIAPPRTMSLYTRLSIVRFFTTGRFEDQCPIGVVRRAVVKDETDEARREEAG